MTMLTVIRTTPALSGLAIDAPAPFHNTSVTNAPVLVVSGVVNLYGYFLYNPNSVWSFLKLYDKATPPVVGTDVPSLTIPVPPIGTCVLNGSDIIDTFSNAFYIAVTIGYLDTDNTSPSTGLLVQLNYKSVNT